MPPRYPWQQDLAAPEFGWSIPDRFNIAEACIDLQDPAATALIVDDGERGIRYSFAELGSASRKLITVLESIGIERGDRVAIMAPQSLPTAAAHMACYRMGAIAVPLSVKFGPDAVTYRLGDCGARALIVHADGYDRLAAALAGLPDIDTVLVIDEPAAAFPSTGRTRYLDYVSAVAGAAESTLRADTAADDPALIIYTSGTTGNPKGALHAHRVLPAHLPGMRLSHNSFPQPGDTIFTPADWAWAGGLLDVLLPALACGVPVVASDRRFSAELAYNLIERHGVRNVFLPPTALKQMRQFGPPPRPLALRSVGSGGESVGPALQDWSKRHLGTGINEFYGQTEINLTVGTAGLGDVPAGSMGRATPGFDVRIRAADGTEVAPGTVGEITVTLPNPGSFLGYWHRPEQTATKTADGFIRTGDLGFADSAANLWFQGRDDDVISSAGYRIGPAEIEECLLTNPDVSMAAVVGVPDADRGEAIVAFVVPADGGAGDPELTKRLQDHVKHRLAFYQYPRRIVYRTALPLTATGKLLRRALRAEAIG